MKHATPDHGSCREILATGPFIAGEQHGTVLDSDQHAVVLCEGDQRFPGFKETRPVVIDASGPVAADEGIDVFQAKRLRGADHHFQMIDARLGNHRIRVEWIGIITQGTQLHPMGRAKFPDIVCPSLGEAGDIDVRNARKFPFGATDGPAHRLDTIEMLVPGKGEDLVEVEFGQDGGDKSKFHGWKGAPKTRSSNGAEAAGRIAQTFDAVGAHLIGEAEQQITHRNAAVTLKTSRLQGAAAGTGEEQG